MQTKSVKRARKNTKKELVIKSLDTRRKLIALILALLMILSLFASLLAENNFTQATKQLTGKGNQKSAQDIEDKLAKQKAEREKLPYTKQELVYISLGPKNTPNQQNLTPTIYVVNYFEAKEDCTVSDYGPYSEVNNLQADKDWQVTDSDNLKHVQFKLKKGEFFYYQGLVNQVAIPWQITYSYELNGHAAKMEEISGKSGQFALNISIKPNTQADTTFADSYIMQVQLALPLASFSNIKAEGAQISIAANKTNVVFMHLPKQSSTYRIEATAKNISIPSSNFAALPLTFQMENYDLLDKQIGQLKQLEFGIGQLNTASNKLGSGYHKLNAGIGKLNNGSKELAEGGDMLGDGAIRFNSGLHQYQAGLQQYLSGVIELSSGLNQVNEGLAKKDLSAYLDLLKDLEKYLSSLESDSENKKSLKELEEEVDSLLTTLKALHNLLSKNKKLLDKLLQLKAPEYDSAKLAQSLNATIKAIDATLKLLDKLPTPSLTSPKQSEISPVPVPKASLVPAAESSPNGVANKLDKQESTIEAQTDGTTDNESDENSSTSLPFTDKSEEAKTNEGAEKLDEIATTTRTSLKGVHNPLLVATTSLTPNKITNANQPVSVTPKKTIFATPSSDLVKANPIANLKKNLEELKAHLEALQEQLQEINALVKALKDLQKQLEDPSNPINNAEGVINKLAEAIQHLEKAKELLHKLNSASPDGKVPNTKEIAEILKSIPQLLDGLKKLADGSNKLAVNALVLQEKGYELLDGSSKLTGGILQYIEGTQKLSKGINELAKGALQLDKGFLAFQSGFNQLGRATNGMSTQAKAKIIATLKDLLGQNFEPHSFISTKNQRLTVSQFVFIFPGTTLVAADSVPKAEQKSKQEQDDKANLAKAPNYKSSFFAKLKALFHKIA